MVPAAGRVGEPVLTRNPKGAVSSINTWWYAPELNAVTRFRTTYSAGPTAGRTYESILEKIELGGFVPETKDSNAAPSKKK